MNFRANISASLAGLLGTPAQTAAAKIAYPTTFPHAGQIPADVALHPRSRADEPAQMALGHSEFVHTDHPSTEPSMGILPNLNDSGNVAESNSDVPVETAAAYGFLPILEFLFSPEYIYQLGPHILQYGILGLSLYAGCQMLESSSRPYEETRLILSPKAKQPYSLANTLPQLILAAGVVWMTYSVLTGHSIPNFGADYLLTGVEYFPDGDLTDFLRSNTTTLAVGVNTALGSAYTLVAGRFVLPFIVNQVLEPIIDRIFRRGQQIELSNRLNRASKLLRRDNYDINEGAESFRALLTNSDLSNFSLLLEKMLYLLDNSKINLEHKLRILNALKSLFTFPKTKEAMSRFDFSQLFSATLPLAIKGTYAERIAVAGLHRAMLENYPPEAKEEIYKNTIGRALKEQALPRNLLEKKGKFPGAGILWAITTPIRIWQTRRQIKKIVDYAVSLLPGLEPIDIELILAQIFLYCPDLRDDGGFHQQVLSELPEDVREQVSIGRAMRSMRGWESPQVDLSGLEAADSDADRLAYFNHQLSSLSDEAQVADVMAATKEYLCKFEPDYQPVVMTRVADWASSRAGENYDFYAVLTELYDHADTTGTGPKRKVNHGTGELMAVSPLFAPRTESLESIGYFDLETIIDAGFVDTPTFKTLFDDEERKVYVLRVLEEGARRQIRELNKYIQSNGAKSILSILRISDPAFSAKVQQLLSTRRDEGLEEDVYNDLFQIFCGDKQSRSSLQKEGRASDSSSDSHKAAVRQKQGEQT